MYPNLLPPASGDPERGEEDAVDSDDSEEGE
jgi:hypothetical protein